MKTDMVELIFAQDGEPFAQQVLHILQASGESTWQAERQPST